MPDMKPESNKEYMENLSLQQAAMKQVDKLSKSNA